ncbi:uncharacterized mitochondrial protein AtMg00310-like [Humulus lupulus]|uniref:uncharacterized mitochondrial protein AtMg00310-like n=1 Tax=Humulus lupulus TaxID=3486 RepID=UPI002B413623|nr:uncharacterized mitochondrial protein AtMg00310-like [Humulus lupulus]
MADILQEYAGLSGQCINLDKSELCVGKKISKDEGSLIATPFGVQLVDCHAQYLCLPTFVRKKKKDIFAYIKNKTWQKLQGWKASLFSQTGRKILVKAVFETLPCYIKSCFKLPKSLIKELHTMAARFWWGSSQVKRKLHWGSWEKICYPKASGHMGFKRLEEFNMVMLAKQGWKIISRLAPLLPRVLKESYFVNEIFFTAMTGSFSSYIWHIILWGRELIMNGSIWRIRS